MSACDNHNNPYLKRVSQQPCVSWHKNTQDILYIWSCDVQTFSFGPILASAAIMCFWLAICYSPQWLCMWALIFCHESSKSGPDTSTRYLNRAPGFEDIFDCNISWTLISMRHETGKFEAEHTARICVARPARLTYGMCYCILYMVASKLGVMYISSRTSHPHNDQHKDFDGQSKMRQAQTCGVTTTLGFQWFFRMAFSHCPENPQYALKVD